MDTTQFNTSDMDKKYQSYVINNMSIRMDRDATSSPFQFTIVDNKIYHDLNEAKAKFEEIRNQYKFVSDKLYLDLKFIDTDDGCCGLIIEERSPDDNKVQAKALYVIEELHD